MRYIILIFRWWFGKHQGILNQVIRNKHEGLDQNKFPRFRIKWTSNECGPNWNDKVGGRIKGSLLELIDLMIVIKPLVSTYFCNYSEYYRNICN